MLARKDQQNLAIQDVCNIQMFQLAVTHLDVSTSIFLSSQFSKYYVSLSEAASSTWFNILGHFNHEVYILFFNLNENIKDFFGTVIWFYDCFQRRI